MNRISVILPVYNESVSIAETLATVLDFAKQHPAYRFIFVDDGSTDATAVILAHALESFDPKRFWLISYPVNCGKGYAIKQGIEQSLDDCICFIDGDLAYSLEHLEALVGKLQDYDVVIGCRNSVAENFNQVSWIRKWTGYLFNWLSRMILNLPYRDMQAGLKGFRYYVAKDLFRRQHISGFAFDAELLYLARQSGYRIGEIPARLSPNHRYKRSNIFLARDSLRMFYDLFRIRLQPKHSIYDKINFVKLRHRRI